jgi:Ca2+-binding RTX toxin-like protein
MMKLRPTDPQDLPEPQEPPELPRPPFPTGVTLFGTNGNDVLIGTNYVDQIYGLDGNDTLRGGGGNDRLYGGAGNDWLEGGVGGDQLDGGAGQDTISYQGSSSSLGVFVDLTLGRGRFGDAEGDIYSGIEVVYGSMFDDLLSGNADSNQFFGLDGNDVLYGYGGNDALYGGIGNDILIGGTGADILSGGSGEDSVEYATSAQGVAVNLANGLGAGGDAAGDSFYGIENVYGSNYADVIVGNAGDNKLWGYDGDDQLSGGAGNDELVGGAGNDLLIGGAGADWFVGGTGTDTVSYEGSSAGVSVYLTSGVTSFSGDAQGDTCYGIENAIGSSHDDSLSGDDDNNELRGLGGDDWLHGNEGNDLLFGSEGNDTLIGGAGADTLDGGNGNDWLTYYSSESGVMINLASGFASGGNATGDTFSGIENVTGSDFNDVLIGDAGNNYLYGRWGNDTLIGGAGEDTLEGGPGHDILTGDTDGIIAADTFVLKHTNAVITDFQQGVDHIRMRDQFTLQDFGDDDELAWGTIGGDTHALDASDKFFFDTASNTLYKCSFSGGTLVLGDAVVTINADVERLQTSDFLLA